MRASRKITALFATAAVLMMAACSKSDKDVSVSAAVDEVPPATLTLERSASPEGASVFFITPSDGATVSNPFRVEFGIAQMSVVKAGEMATAAGHHHLLIDTEIPNLGEPVPADSRHIHFGDASTSTELTLEPGQHTLRLLFADYRHIPHDPVVQSDAITITVE